MASDIDAILAYGYDLGGHNNWKLHGNERGAYRFMWNQIGGFAYDAEPILHKAGIGRDQVEILWYGRDTGSITDPKAYVLAAAKHTTTEKTALGIDPVQLQPRPEWQAHLDLALQALGLRPLAGPQWLLLATYGT